MFIKMMLVMWLTLGCLSLLPAVSYAVYFATAAKPRPGYQLKLFPYFYTADTRTNKDGNPAVNDLGLKRYGVGIGSFYQIGDLTLSAVIPVGKLEVDKLKSDDAGFGDIQLRAGWYLPVEWVSILPTLMIKVPTGSFDKKCAANMGDGQTDLVAELYFFKLVQPFSFDAVLKYNTRFRNPDSDVTPGNEFSAEGLVTLRLAEKIRVGPAVNFLIGGDNKKGGKTLVDSGLMRFSAGGEIWFGRFERANISVAAYQDLLTRNTNEGITVMSRIVFNF